MWYSFAIYVKDFVFFYKTVYSFSCMHPHLLLFFVQYYDSLGFHFRLRLYCESNKQKQEYKRELENLFNGSTLIERIYDPEKNKYGEKLDVYEMYSVGLSMLILKYHPYVRDARLIQDVVELLTKSFGCNSRDFFEYYKAYWSKKKQTFREVGFVSQKTACETIDIIEHEYIIILRHTIQKAYNPNDSFLNRNVCFNYLHMTLNKIGLLIADELTLLNKMGV